MRRESGFTIVEIIIAALILAAIASGIALAALSGDRLRGKAKLGAALTQTGLKVQEELVTDRSWMERTECRVIDSPCDISAGIRGEALELEDVDGTATLTYARSTALDSEVDGIAPNDSDGVIPDYYRIEIEIRPVAAVATRYGTTPDRAARQLVTTIDRRGVEQVGSLAVELCRVTNQSDERLAIQGCRNSGFSSIEIAGCPPVPRDGCTQAFSWAAGRPASETNPSAFVTLRRIAPSSMPFRLENASTGESWSSASANVVGGIAIFENIPAGTYYLRNLPSSAGANSERWKSKEIPSFHGSPTDSISRPSAVVEPGVRNRALVLFRPEKTDSGVNMYFDRETYTRRLVGPRTSPREVSVPPWEPTTSYTGPSAAEMCEAVDAYNRAMSSTFGDYNCTDIAFGPPNCATVLVSGQYWQYTPGSGTHIRYGFGGGAGMMEADPPGTGEFTSVTLSNARYARFCTYYAEYLWHEYYTWDGNVTTNVRPGAVRGVTYFIEPKPDNRVVDLDTGSARIPVSVCTVPQRGQCPGPLDQLSPGLSTGIRVAPDDAGDAARNENINAMPGWARNRGLWTRPNGEIIGGDNASHGTNPGVPLRGRGECYWRSVRFAGESEGSCDPCSPTWTPGFTVPDACSIITRTHWERPAIERYWYYDPVTGAVQLDGEDDLPTREGDTPYPPWRCSTPVPRIAPTSTCRPFPTGGGGTPGIPETRHPSNITSGAGVVAQSSFSMGGG